MKTISILCKLCGKRFSPKQLTRAKFCSKTCSQRWRRKDKVFQKWLASERRGEAILVRPNEEDIKNGIPGDATHSVPMEVS